MTTWAARICSSAAHCHLEQLLQIARNLGLITAGSLICALAINGVLVPNNFVSGGVVGVTLVLHHIIPWLPLGLGYLVLNLPLFAVGLKQVSPAFFIYSLAGTAIFTLAVDLVDLRLPINDPLPAAVAAGILSGLGGGLILRSQGTAGGLDILSVVLYRRYSIRLGSTVMALNATVLLTSCLLFPLQAVIYSVIYIFVSSKVLDMVVTGISQRKLVFVVSRRARQLAALLLKSSNSGATIIPATGAFSGGERELLYTAVNFKELANLKKAIQKEDPEAFMVITDTSEVRGQRIKTS